jgi:hypothetical protein
MMMPNNISHHAFRLIAATATLLLLPVNSALACSTAQWDDTSIGAAVTADTAAVYEGACGLRLGLSGTASGWVKDRVPGTVSPGVSEYVARFYAYVDDAQIANGESLTIFSALNAGATELFGLDVKGSNTGAVLHLYANDNGNTVEGIGDVPVEPGWRAISVHWTTGAGTGELHLSVDRNQSAQSITGLTNAGQIIDSVNLGIVNGNTAAVSGNIDIDSFTSRRTGPTGLLITKACSGTNVTVKNATFLSGAITCNASTGLIFNNRVTFDPGATVAVQAPTVTIRNGTRVRQGAVLDITVQ